MAGSWTRYMFIIISSLLLVLLLLRYPLGPMILGVQSSGEIAFGSAYSLTQRLVSTINMMSASPQNETAIIRLNPIKCSINFNTTYNYIESHVEYLGSSSFGLFVFQDVNLIAPNKINCNEMDWKEIYVTKIGNNITVSE